METKFETHEHDKLVFKSETTADTIELIDGVNDVKILTIMLNLPTEEGTLESFVITADRHIKAERYIKLERYGYNYKLIADGSVYIVE